jgi:putative Holliday junction resolvase
MNDTAGLPSDVHPGGPTSAGVTPPIAMPTAIPASTPPSTPPLIPAAGRVLGVDLGTARVGVAVSDGAQRLATGATRVDRVRDRSREHRALAAVVAEYGAVGVVVGLPLSLSGAHGPAAVRALEEVDVLRGSLAVPVEVIDERFSTVSAQVALRAGGRPARRQREVVDQTAAAVVLQVWLDRRSAAVGPTLRPSDVPAAP